MGPDLALRPIDDVEICHDLVSFTAILFIITELPLNIPEDSFPSVGVKTTKGARKFRGYEAVRSEVL
jgi:hypothetical protein